MAKNKKLILIFDGIDESICDRGSLLSFLEFILNNNFSALLTCRIEYRPFFDLLQTIVASRRVYTYLELTEWKLPQWETYIHGLLSKYPKKDEEISRFFDNVKSEMYSTLPNRPLFLKMLSDLEINNKTGIAISPDMAENLSEIYYKFIKWKIRDDYFRKGGVHKFDLKIFEKECFSLLRDIAILEYQTSQKEKESQVTLEKIRKICLNNKFIELNEEYISNILLKSSLFAILKRTDNDVYTFSHKSFMEYLVSFSLANCIFPEDRNISNSVCDDIWNNFQTHEVSQHFVREVKRIQATLILSTEETIAYIANAFKKIVDEQKGHYMKYDERLQEVLYYIGKLNVNSRELVDTLVHIIEYKDQYDPVYFRSASLALSRISDPSYCERYVLLLATDMKKEARDFSINQTIQKQYYGESTLMPILKRDIDEYISKRNTSSIISLKIWTYFTTIKPNPLDVSSLKKYLEKVKRSAVEQGHKQILMLCKEISQFLKRNV